ncbi:MAG TPA: class E sortase [Acidimicrobiia bacterium]|jgi:sortase A
MLHGRRLLAALVLAAGTALVAPGVAAAATLPVPEHTPAPYDASRPGNPIGRIVIPSVGIDRVLYDQVTALSINKGPSHWPGTAMPGQLGNVVVAGHRTTHGSPFLRLGELHAGDLIEFVMPNGTFAYRVTGLEIVSPSAMWIVDQHDASEVTLFTCHPPGSSSERLVVHGVLAPLPAPTAPAAPAALVFNGRGPFHQM